MENKLLSGSPLSSLVRFMLPLLMANLLQTGYSVVDMIIVGRYVGSEGIAAISSAATIGYIIQSVCTGFTTGGSVLVAQYTGAQNTKGQRRTIGTLFSVSAIAAAILTIASLIAYSPVLTAMQVPPAAMQYAVDYIRVICLGTAFMFGYNAVCAVMRGFGDSKSPLIYILIATLCNIFLDLLLVGKSGLKTQGAAIATVASQGISFGAAFIHLRTKGFFSNFKRKDFRISRIQSRLILKIGLPVALQMAVLNISYLIVAGLLNGYGVVVAAAAGIGLKINTFAVIPCWAIGQAVTTVAGQCTGAQNTKRAKQILKSGILLSLGIQACIILLVQVFSGQIIALFDSNPRVICEGILYLRICCSVNGLAYVLMFTINSFATGVGHSLFAMINSLFQSVALRIILCMTLSVAMGHVGIYWGEFLSPIPCAVVGLVYFKSGRWEKNVGIIERMLS